MPCHPAVGLSGIQATTGQRISIEGILEKDLDEIMGLLGKVGDPCPQSITACRGLGACKRGLQNTHAMALQIEKILMKFTEMPAHLKAGLSGCPRCCGASYVKDIGLVGTPKGWTLTFGGNAGRRVRSGDELLTDVSEETVLKTIATLLSYYCSNANPRERTARFAERVGIDEIKSVL